MEDAAALRVSHIEHVVLLVRGIDRAIAFYERVLGCDVEARLPHLAMAELCAGSSHITLVDVSAAEGAWAAPPVPGGRNVDHIALAVDASSESELRAHLAGHDVAVVEERVEERNGARALSLYVRDPDGTTIELIVNELDPVR